MKSKFLLYFLLFFGGFYAANAQNFTFAPIGAEWYHEAVRNTVFRVYVDSTVTKNGIECRKINYEAIPERTDYGMPVNGPAAQYVYNNDDTVFIFNELIDEFTPLFVYNVNEGDTVKLPIFPVQCGSPGMTDRTFGFVIDSIRTVMYDQTPLKTYYYQPLMDEDFVYSWVSEENWDSLHYYVETIGGFHSGLMPLCLKICGFTLDDTCVIPGSLRCYTDAGNAIKITDTCIIPPTGISDKEFDKELISIYPLPAIEELHIQNDSKYEISDVILYNVNGQKIHSQQSGANISVVSFSSGIYFLKISFKDNNHVYTTTVQVQ